MAKPTSRSPDSNIQHEGAIENGYGTTFIKNGAPESRAAAAAIIGVPAEQAAHAKRGGAAAAETTSREGVTTPSTEPAIATLNGRSATTAAIVTGAAPTHAKRRAPVSAP